MPNAYISGTGFYVPPTVVTNDDLVEKYGIETSDEWIQKRTGIQERRYAEAGQTHLTLVRRLQNRRLRQRD